MTDDDTSPEALAVLPPCTLCGDPAGEHELLPRWGALGPCTRPGCRCPAWGFAGEIEDEQVRGRPVRCPHCRWALTWREAQSGDSGARLEAHIQWNHPGAPKAMERR